MARKSPESASKKEKGTARIPARQKKGKEKEDPSASPRRETDHGKIIAMGGGEREKKASLQYFSAYRHKRVSRREQPAIFGLSLDVMRSEGAGRRWLEKIKGGKGLDFDDSGSAS